MSKEFTILHISDLHYDKSKQEQSSILVSDLINDLELLRKTENIKIDAILSTGDMVNNGLEKDLFNECYNNVIIPIVQKIELDSKNFLYIPGNHEIDRSKVNQDFQNGFIKRIINADIDKENFSNEWLTKKTQNFFDFINELYPWDNDEVIKNITLTLNGNKVGISLYNTSWCSSSDSSKDVKNIFMPPIKAKEKYQEIKDCDYKIVMMHHPIDWYEDANADKIQHVLSQYNLVLCGHKHLENNKLEQKGPLKTLYNYAHKLLPLDDKESGYSIISINLLNGKARVFYREYNSKTGGFCTGITNLCQDENGLKYSEYEIGKFNSDRQICYKIFDGIRHNFIENLDDLFITNALEQNKKQFDDLFVDFSFSDYPIYSEHSKKGGKKDKDKTYSINDIVDMDQTIKIYGQKESGKTVLAYSLAKFYLDNFEKYCKIPIVIDCKKAKLTNTNIKNIIASCVFELLDEKCELSKEEISKLLNNDMLVLIFDEPSCLTSKQKKERMSLNLKQFLINNYNPLVFGEEDEAFIESEVSSNKKAFFIRPYSKNAVRKLINNISLIENDNRYIENVINYFYANALPRTPFVISLIAAVCSRNKDVIPTNQAKILEQFLENVLEKINVVEQLSSTYDFNNKEDFLSCFAFELYKKNKFSMKKEDFTSFVNSYHAERGFSLEDSKFDSIFFNKNILVKDGLSVYFRFSCFNYYYLAKYAMKNNSFLDSIIDNCQFASNAEILFYYTGLKRDNDKLLRTIITHMNDNLNDSMIEEDIFNKDPIKTMLGLTDDSVSRMIESGDKIDQKEKDKITDLGDNSFNYNPNGAIINEKDINLERLYFVLGFTIKNSEELNVNIKKEAMEIYFKAAYVLWNNFRLDMLNFAKHINDSIKTENGNIDEELKKAYEIFEDILRISIPIAISQQMLENTATEKMRKVYESLLAEMEYNTAEKMFLTFLLIDLNYKNIEKVINEFIKNTSNKNYLKVCLVKLIYSYYFGVIPDNSKLPNFIADCYIKIVDGKKEQKGQIIQSIKKQGFNEKFLDFDD